MSGTGIPTLGRIGEWVSYWPRPRPARDWPVPKSDLRPAHRSARELGLQPLRKPALVTRGDVLKIGHFAPFSQFLHIKCRNFPDVLSIHVYL